MIDSEVIESKVDIVERNLGLLRVLSGESRGEFKASYRDVQAAKHSLQEAIEACLDIANHVISASGFRRAETYGEMFQVLEEQEIIPPGLSEKLQDMAGFRNLLVHRYGDIDLDRLYVIMRDDTEDIKRFVSIILEYLD